MKNLIYVTVSALILFGCQQTERLQNRNVNQAVLNIETPESFNLNLTETVAFHAGILLETVQGEDIFNAISLEDYPEAWAIDAKGKVLPNVPVIKELLDYVMISKHNEKPVLNQSMIVFNPESHERFCVSIGQADQDFTIETCHVAGA